MMKRLALLGGVLAVGLIASQSIAGIANTKHNLSSTSNFNIKSTETDEICVFCHTPHKANTDFSGAPLWNKATPSGTFTLYGQTVAGNSPDTNGPNAPSMACLSCHDGTSAINSVFNAPGAGSAVSYLQMAGQTTADTAYSLNQAQTDGLLTNSLAIIGIVLTDDHPVSIQYIPETNASLKPLTSTLPGAWIVKGQVKTDGWTVADLLKPDPNNPTVRNRVECSSCHDPHVDSTDPNTPFPMFLRTSNTGSNLCLGCHNK